MVAAVIIGILATIGLMVFSSSMQKSRDSRRKKDLRSLVDALQMYMSENGEYPPAGAAGWRGYIQGRNFCNNQFLAAIEYYMDIVPSDPQARQEKEYYYHKISNTEYCLVSELERTDDPERIDQADPRTYIMNNFGGCDIQSSCGTAMQTPHYVVTNP